MGLIINGSVGAPKKAFLVAGAKGAIVGRVKLKNRQEADVVVNEETGEKKAIMDGSAITDGKLNSDMKLIDDGEGDDFVRVPTRSRTLPRTEQESSAALLELVDNNTKNDSAPAQVCASTTPYMDKSPQYLARS